MSSNVAGVISLGSAGLRHAQLLIERGFDVVALRSRLGPTVHPTPGSIVEVRSIEQLLKRAPSFCVVSSPTSLHLKQVSELVEGQVPVLVEKPLIGSAVALDELDSRGKLFGIPIVVAYHLRFHPGLSKLGDYLASGALGRPLLARVAWGEYLPDWHPGEDFRRGYAARSDQDGGPLATLSHTLDYCIRLFGRVDNSQAVSTNFGSLDIDVPEVSVINLHHTTGTLSSISLDFVTQPPQHKIEISGSSGFVSLDFHTSALSLRSRSNGQEEAFDFGDSASIRRNCFSQQIDDFVLNLTTTSGGLNSHDLHVAKVVSSLHQAQPFSIPQR